MCAIFYNTDFVQTASARTAIWPTSWRWSGMANSLTSRKGLYARFFNAIGQQIRNIIWGCIDHRPGSYEYVPTNYEPLHLLAVPVGVNIPFDFSCGINLLDKRRILLDKDGIISDRQNVILCKSCYWGWASEGHFDSVESEYSNIRWRIVDFSNHTCP